MIDEAVQGRSPGLGFAPPVLQRREWRYDEKGALNPFIGSKVMNERRDLHCLMDSDCERTFRYDQTGFAKAHLIGQNRITILRPVERHPFDSVNLVVT